MSGPTIYGLEFQARALASLVAPEGDPAAECSEFLVGTQTVKSDLNQIHHLVFNEEEDTLLTAVHGFADGQISHLAACPNAQHSRLFVACYSPSRPEHGGLGQARTRASLFRLPENTEESPQSPAPLQALMGFQDAEQGRRFGVAWHPTQANSVAFLDSTGLSVWDLDLQAKQAQASLTLEQSGAPDTGLHHGACAWSPHHNCSFLAATIGPHVQGWDLRSSKETFRIANAHASQTRGLDFNPNKQHYLATCGDDGAVKFWDTRKPDEALLAFRNHSHWVWSVRYNSFHDQLVLSSSSDCQVLLSGAASLSSDIYGGLDDDNDDESDGDEERQKPLQDGEIARFDEHEDSVYAVEWSAVDPWIFASLSFDGRVIINKVPDKVKYRILCL